MKRAANVLALSTARMAAQVAKLNAEWSAKVQKEVAEKNELLKQLHDLKRQRTE